MGMVMVFMFVVFVVEDIVIVEGVMIVDVVNCEEQDYSVKMIVVDIKMLMIQCDILQLVSIVS